MPRLTINMTYNNKFVGNNYYHHIHVKLDDNKVYSVMATSEEAMEILDNVTKRVEELNSGENFEQEYLLAQCDIAAMS